MLGSQVCQQIQYEFIISMFSRTHSKIELQQRYTWRQRIVNVLRFEEWLERLQQPIMLEQVLASAFRFEDWPWWLLEL
jgi:hypothetical protein